VSSDCLKQPYLQAAAQLLELLLLHCLLQTAQAADERVQVRKVRGISLEASEVYLVRAFLILRYATCNAL